MSSAYNHAKRSHRSESRKQAVFNTNARRVLINQTQKPRKVNLFKRLVQAIRRPAEGKA